MSYQVMERHGGNIDAYYKVKEANLKRLHRYHIFPTTLYSGKGKTTETFKKISGCQRQKWVGRTNR